LGPLGSLQELFFLAGGGDPSCFFKGVYPLVIKGGNGKSPKNDGCSGNIIQKWDPEGNPIINHPPNKLCVKKKIGGINYPPNGYMDKW